MAEQPRRVNFFTGMLLTAEDLAVEQQYHREMRYLHNRLHGFGIVSGLDVGVSPGKVSVEPGLAIDPCGRELVLTQPLTVRLDPHQSGRRWIRDLVIAWHETPDSAEAGPDGTEVFTRWVEHPELSVVAAGKRSPGALLLARLSRTPGGAVDVDVSVRRLLRPEDSGSGT